jgi:uncharacterized RDD family membrane protein YckC
MSDRIFATILDGFLLLPALVATIVLSAHWNHIPPSEDGDINLVGIPALEAMSLSLLISCVYTFLSEAFYSRTLGKDVMGVEVRSKNGTPCSIRKAFLRNLLRPVDALGFYFVGFLVAINSQQNLRIGDRIAGTVVTENPEARRWRAFLILAAAIAMLSYLASAVHLVPTKP